MQYVLSLSYGKDSLACLEAIKLLGLPLDRIIHAEVWATDTIPADLPPMVEFKAKADAIIKERYGIAVEHISAVERERERDGYPSSDSSTSDSTVESEPGKFTDSLCCEEHGVTLISKFKPSTSFAKRTYERWFYRVPARQAQNSQIEGTIVGFPYQQRPWCNSKLKTKALQQPFYQAPLHKELTQILCNISGLLQTSRKESSDILDPV